MTDTTKACQALCLFIVGAGIGPGGPARATMSNEQLAATETDARFGGRGNDSHEGHRERISKRIYRESLTKG